MLDKADAFLALVRTLPLPLSAALDKLPRDIARQVEEIRLRAGRPLALTLQGRTGFISPTGCLHDVPEGGLPITAALLEDTFLRLCAYSVHTREAELEAGYLAVQGGHRAGLCGQAVVSEGRVRGFSPLSGINLRVASERHGCASPLLHLVESTAEGLRAGLLIAGPPGSGKTTLLRDIARHLGHGGYRTTVADERGEIAAVYGGVPQNDVGQCDVLSGYGKADAIALATRTLNPQILILDEIGSEAEADSVIRALWAGVACVATVHAPHLQGLMRHAAAATLIRSGVFAHIAVLGERPGDIADVTNAAQLLRGGGIHVA